MADGLSIGSLSVSGGLTRLTGTSSKLDTEAIVAAAYEAKRLPAVRLEQRISRNEARGAALGELKALLQNLKDSVAGLRNPPGLLGANDNVFEAKQAFLTGGGAVPAAELVGVERRERRRDRQLHARGRSPGDGAQARGPAGRRRRPDAGRCVERRRRLRRHARDRPRRRRQGGRRRRRRHVRRRPACGDQCRLGADRCLGQRPFGLADRPSPRADRDRDRARDRACRRRRRRDHRPDERGVAPGGADRADLGRRRSGRAGGQPDRRRVAGRHHRPLSGRARLRR